MTLKTYALYTHPSGYTEGDWDGARYLNEKPLEPKGYLVAVEDAVRVNLVPVNMNTDPFSFMNLRKTDDDRFYRKSDVDYLMEVKRLQLEGHESKIMSPESVFAYMLAEVIPVPTREQMEIVWKKAGM